MASTVAAYSLVPVAAFRSRGTLANHFFARNRIPISIKLQRLAQARASAEEDGPTDKRNRETLWRKELTGVDGLPNIAANLDTDLQQDIQRLTERREVEKRLESFRYGGNQTQSNEAGKTLGFQEVVEKLLVLDFFFILFILTWLVAGLGEKAILQSSQLIDAWLPLWSSVFQPALGVFMAGALVSAISSWSAKKPR